MAPKFMFYKIDKQYFVFFIFQKSSTFFWITSLKCNCQPPFLTLPLHHQKLCNDS